jgi:oleate hydratase
MDGRSPLEMKLPMPLEALKKPILRKIDKTVVGKLLRDHGVLKDWMV